jgi:hypothetical protein
MGPSTNQPVNGLHSVALILRLRLWNLWCLEGVQAREDPRMKKKPCIVIFPF